MGAPPPIEQSCYWLASLPRRTPFPSLSGNGHADVAIAGGGFTGLWTALALKRLEPECAVVLLEAQTLAYGASGRNAGIVGETFDHSHALAIAHFGIDEAVRLAALARANLDQMEQFVSERGLDADFARTGQLFVALDDRQCAGLEASLAATRQMGIDDWRLLDATETRAEISSLLYRGGLLAPKAATVHPAKLALALAREAERAGVVFHERTPVVRFEPASGGVRILTDQGQLRARRLILATNAYTHLLAPSIGRRFLPLYDYVIASEPLAPTMLTALGWRRRSGVTDLRTFFNYYRLTRDNRIVWGTSEALYASGDRVASDLDHSDEQFAELRRSFRRHFPQLSELGFPFAWGGPIASTTRLTPFFGSLAGGKVLYGLGYTGHGVGTTRIAGQILAHLALERRSELTELALVRKKPWPFPPRALRRLAVDWVTRDLRGLDQGQAPTRLLRLLDRLGIGFSS